MRARRFLLAVPICAAVISAAVLLTAATTRAAGGACDAGTPNQVTWIGSDDQYWATDSAWSTGHIPTANQNVCIPAGSGRVLIVTDAVAASIEAHRPIWEQGGSLTVTPTAGQESSTDSSYRLSKGTFTSTENWTFKSGGTLLWDGGSTIAGAGTTKFESGAHLTINDQAANSSHTHYVTDGRVLHVDGDATWSDADDIGLANAAGFELAGPMTVSNSQSFFSACCGTTPSMKVLA